MTFEIRKELRNLSFITSSRFLNTVQTYMEKRNGLLHPLFYQLRKLRHHVCNLGIPTTLHPDNTAFVVLARDILGE